MAIGKIKLTITYDGSDYHGWQIQPGQKTIQGTIAEAIEILTGSKVTVTGASRTDAGVSALGQVATVWLDTPVPVENLAKALTQRLPEQIAIKEAVEVDADFDAISSAKTKMYRYSIFTGPVRPVFQIRRCWHRPGKLDVEIMAEVAEKFVGKKDFKSFAAAADERQSSVRTIIQCNVGKKEDWIYIDIEADGFLYNMVRNIVGTLVEIGRGRWQPYIIDEILKAKDRNAAGPIAPAAGLCLMWITQTDRFNA